VIIWKNFPLIFMLELNEGVNSLQNSIISPLKGKSFLENEKLFVFF